jgi:transposase
MLMRHLDGILNYCHEKVPFGKVEAINGNIRAMLRRGRGYRDHCSRSRRSPPAAASAKPHEHRPSYRFW